MNLIYIILNAYVDSFSVIQSFDTRLSIKILWFDYKADERIIRVVFEFEILSNSEDELRLDNVADHGLRFLINNEFVVK